MTAAVLIQDIKWCDSSTLLSLTIQLYYDHEISLKFITGLFVWQRPRFQMTKHTPYNPVAMTERARIVWLWLGGASVRSISQQTGASLSTVYRVIRRSHGRNSIKLRQELLREKRNPWWKESKFTAPRGSSCDILQRFSYEKIYPWEENATIIKGHFLGRSKGGFPFYHHFDYSHFLANNFCQLCY